MYLMVCLYSVVNMAPSQRKDKKAKVSATSKTVMENGHIDNSDNPETLIGSQYGMAKHKRKEPEMLSMNGAFDDMPILGLPAQNRPEDDGKFSFLFLLFCNAFYIGIVLCVCSFL
jgi:hypothetical protein